MKSTLLGSTALIVLALTTISLSSLVGPAESIKFPHLLRRGSESYEDRSAIGDGPDKKEGDSIMRNDGRELTNVFERGKGKGKELEKHDIAPFASFISFMPFMNFM